MDPAANVRALLKGLTEKIDILDTSLEALVKGSAAETAEKLPLLDRAKFYATLSLNSVDAKNHPVYRELARVKQYFEKIKAAEEASKPRTQRLDLAAASRFIKHGLAGNHDLSAEEESAADSTAAAKKRKISETNDDEEDLEASSNEPEEDDEYAEAPSNPEMASTSAANASIAKRPSKKRAKKKKKQFQGPPANQ